MFATNPVTRFAIKAHGAQNNPIVFAHGLGCDQAMWKDVAPAFRSRHQIVLFDLMG